MVNPGHRERWTGVSHLTALGNGWEPRVAGALGRERAQHRLRPGSGDVRALCTPSMGGGGSGPFTSTVTWGHLASPGGQNALSDC